jgi:hypothetical protein
VAIVAGVDPHNGWLEVQGTRYQCITGTVTQRAIIMSSEFDVKLPLEAPGYLEAFAGMAGKVPIQVVVRAHGSETAIIKGNIDKIEFGLVPGIIKVYGRDDTTALHEKRTTDKWVNRKGSDIVTDLAQRAGLKASAQASKTYAGKKIVQDFVKLTDNISYFMAIHKLAEFDGMRVFMDKNGVLNYKASGSGGDYPVYWQRPQPGKPMVSDCLDLRIIHDMLASCEQNCTVNSWNNREKKVETSNYIVPGAQPPRITLQDIGNLKNEQTTALAFNLAHSYANHEFEIRAVVVGDPSIDVSQNVVLSGTGFFDQPYAIDTITHEFGINGYTTTINSKNAKEGRK